MMTYQFGNIAVEVVKGNIVAQPDMECIVNAANAQLAPGGGVAGAIHRAAGPGLYDECRPLAPIRPGDAVLTSGHDLPNRCVVHCLGPVYGRDKPEAELLASCYSKALDLAERQAIESIAFPALSTGAFGYPPAAAAEVALSRVTGIIPRLRSVKRIRFVLFDESSVEVYREVLARLAGELGGRG
jgi:O-acetyl-ADP-ribose deacetylase